MRRTPGESCPRLTLNYGLRYEYNLPQSDIHNNILGFFPGQQSTRFPDAPSGILYPGDPGTPNKALVYPDYNNFAPRFGFAWDIFGNAKLVMRGGFGIFYDIEDGALNLQFGGQPPFGAVSNFFPVRLHRHHRGHCERPYHALRPAKIRFRSPPPGRYGTFEIPKLPFAYTTFPHFRTPYSENFNYGFQWQATRDTMVEAVYVGSLGRKLISPGRNELSRPSDHAATTQPVWLRESRLRSAADRNGSGYCAVHGWSFADRSERYGHWSNPAIH